MTTDKTMKVLLAVIALGLWANVVLPMVKPGPAIAQGTSDLYLANIERSLRRIEQGQCLNTKLC